MFQAVELPACVRYLHARLPNVYLYDLAPAAHVTPQLYSTFAYLLSRQEYGSLFKVIQQILHSNNLIYTDFIY